jgi:hypothetical protein
MVAGVEPVLDQGLVVVFRFVREGKEAPQQFLLAGVLALLEQRLGISEIPSFFRVMMGTLDHR